MSPNHKLAITNLINAINQGYDFDWGFTYDDCPMMQLYEHYDPNHQRNLINVMPELCVDVQLANVDHEANNDCGMRVNTWLAKCFGDGIFFEVNQIVA